MTQQPDNTLAELRGKIDELEQSDREFTGKANILLDQTIAIGDELDTLSKAVNGYITESRANREADRERLDLLEMRLDADRERILAHEERFNTMQQNIERILQYLQNQYPGNGQAK